MLSNYDLERACRKLQIPLGLPVVQKDQLKGRRHNRGKAYIVNLQNSDDGNGIHWVAGYLPLKGGKAFYFDPFGMDNPVEIDEFFKPFKVRSSSIQIQDIGGSQCGSYCLAWLYHMSRKGGTSDGFCRLFSKDTSQNRRVLQAMLSVL